MRHFDLGLCVGCLRALEEYFKDQYCSVHDADFASVFRIISPVKVSFDITYLSWREFVVEDYYIDRCFRFFVLNDELPYFLEFTGTDVGIGIGEEKSLHEAFDRDDVTCIGEESEFFEVFFGTIFRLLRCYESN